MKPVRKVFRWVWMVSLALVLVVITLGGLAYEQARVDRAVKLHPQNTQQGLTLGKGPDLHLDLRVGGMDGEGRLLFWRLNDAAVRDPFFLEPGDDYGVILMNQGGEGRPVARYLLASQSTRRVLDTLGFSEFKRAVAEIPKGKVIGIYGTCSVGLWQGLSKGVMGDFEKVLASTGARVNREGGRIVCTCREPGR